MADLKKEAWEDQNEKLATALKEVEVALKAAHQSRNTTRYLNLLTNKIKDVFKDKNTDKKSPKKVRKPYVNFQKLHN